jgi:uncharacterized membrane protein YjfL (UPF0719 family)
MDIELIAQVIAYSAVGLVVLVAGFLVLDLITPGKLGHLVMERRPNAAILAAGILLSLGLILYFAIYFTGAGWEGLVDAAVYGAVGVLAQAGSFAVVEALTPAASAASWRTRSCIRPPSSPRPRRSRSR